MSAVLIQTLRSRWFGLLVQAGLWLLLYLAVTRVGGRAPEFRDDTSFSIPVQSPVPVGKLGALFATGEWSKSLVPTNTLNPFFTRYFVPPPSPAPPPPPTTRKIEVTYLGFYQTADSPRRAVVRIADAFVVAPVGGTVANQLFVAEAALGSLTLTNHLLQTNVLTLNVKKELEVPLQ